MDIFSHLNIQRFALYYELELEYYVYIYIGLINPLLANWMLLENVRI